MSTDQNEFEVTGLKILGTVSHVQKTKTAAQFCRVRPLYREADGKWIPISDARLSFADVGLVFWWNPNIRVRTGSALTFSVIDDRHHYEKGKGLDRYQIRSGTAAPPIEILRISAELDPATIRRRIAAGSFSAIWPPLGQSLIALNGAPRRWLGLFEATYGEDGDEIGAMLTSDSSTGFMRTYEIDETQFQTVLLSGSNHLLLRPGSVLPPPEGFFNVQSDADLVKALGNLVRRESDTADAELFRKRAIEDAIKILSLEGGGSRDRPRDQARLEAAKSLRDELRISEGDRKEIERILEDLPLIENIREQIRATYESDYAERFAKIQDDARAEIASEYESANRELGELQAKTAGLKSQAVKLVTETKTALAALVENAVSKIAEDVVIREVLSIGRSESVKDGKPRGGSTPTSLGSLNEVSDHVVNVAKSQGQDPYVASVLISLMAGAQITLVAGSRALSLSKSAAHAIGGAGACLVPIAPTIFSLSDLLNAPCAPVGDLPCHAECLGEFILKAMQHDQMSVVILQGANRAPPENIFLELADADTGDYNLPIRWRELGGSVKTGLSDRRILFLATLTDGSSTFRFSKSLGIRLPMIWADRREMPKIDESEAPVPANGSVLFKVWKTAKDHDYKDESRALAKLFTLPEYEPLRVGISELLRGVCGMLGSDDAGSAEAIWALTCGRVEDNRLKDVIAAFGKDAAIRFGKVMEAGASTLARSYFDQGLDK